MERSNIFPDSGAYHVSRIQLLRYESVLRTVTYEALNSSPAERNPDQHLLLTNMCTDSACPKRIFCRREDVDPVARLFT